VFLAFAILTFWYTNGKSFSRSGEESTLYESRLSSISSLESLRDESKPQNQALDWIVNRDPLHLSFSNPSVQIRYVMTLFVMSTFPPLETENYLLMYGDMDVCDWTGVSCGSDGLIHEISLGKYQLKSSNIL